MGVEVCYEPALFSDKCIVRAARGDTIVFPHVDSCMAVTVFQGVGEKFWAIGGHCPMFDEKSDPFSPGAAADTLVRFCERMCDSEKIRSYPIEKVIFVGGNKRKVVTQFEHYSIGRALGVFGLARLPNAANWGVGNVRNCEGGVDVFVDLPKQRLSVQQYQKDPSQEAFASPTLCPSPVFSKQVYDIVGKIVCPPDTYFF